MLVTVALNAVGKDAGIPEKLCIKSNFSGLHDEIDICAIEARFYHFMVDHMKCPTVQCYYADWEDDGSGQGLIIFDDMEKFGGKFGSSLDTNGVDGVAKGIEGLDVLNVSLWGNLTLDQLHCLQTALAKPIRSESRRGGTVCVGQGRHR